MSSDAVGQMLESIFRDTEEDGAEFYGFSYSDLNGKVDEMLLSDPVELENISQDSNSKTSGYGSSGREVDSDIDDSDSDILTDSDYEEISRDKREKAIKERRALLQSLMSDLRNDAIFKKMNTIKPSAAKARTARRTYRPRVIDNYYLPPVTRRRSKLGDPSFVDDDESSGKYRKPKLVVRFRPKRKLSSSEADSSTIKRPCRRSFTQDHVIIDVKDVTEDMLADIAVHSVGKTYNAVSGTSCHQCRQKTMDTKSCCRNGECIGVRGQFCGPCLQNRYGESVRDALLDPEWSCPVCRGFCNCSICRNRAGKAATGILIGLARFHGFSNVKDYLASLKSENSFVVEDE